MAIFFIYLFWLIVKALNMELVGSLLGQVIGVGVIALIIVFQQEIRRFLLVIGNRYIAGHRSDNSSCTFRDAAQGSYRND
jgi:diadenylate cyclase